MNKSRLVEWTWTAGYKLTVRETETEEETEIRPACKVYIQTIAR